MAGMHGLSSGTRFGGIAVRHREFMYLHSDALLGITLAVSSKDCPGMSPVSPLNSIARRASDPDSIATNEPIQTRMKLKLIHTYFLFGHSYIFRWVGMLQRMLNGVWVVFNCIPS